MKKLIKDNVIEFIRECIKNNESFSTHEFVLYLINDLGEKNLLGTLPQVKDEDGDMEELDFENCEILGFDNDSITICAGGDWQEPLTFSLKMDGEKVVCEVDGPGYSEGMRSSDFLYELFEVSMEEMGAIADDYGTFVKFTSDFERKLTTFYREAKERILDEVETSEHTEGYKTSALGTDSYPEGLMTTSAMEPVEEPKVSLQELKDFDIESIASKEEAEEFKNKILKADEKDILRYINHLRYIQYHCDRGTGYINRIMKILSSSELKEKEKESGLEFGVSEELVFPVVRVLEESDMNLEINGKMYTIKAELVDDFENVLVLFDAEKLSTMAFIEKDGTKYIYEIMDHPQDYLNSIVNTPVGTKVSIYTTIVDKHYIPKIFTKVEAKPIQCEFSPTTKTDRGVLTPTVSGTYSILKKENILFPKGLGSVEITDKPGEDFEPEEKIEKVVPYKEFKFVEETHFILDEGENPLTQISFNLIKGDVYEVEDFFFNKFGYVRVGESWVLENKNIQFYIRKLINAGATISINPRTKSNFLQKFLWDKKLDELVNRKMKLELVQEIKTREELMEFLEKTESTKYLPYGTIRAILEGVQKSFGEKHIVFDSADRLRIFKMNEFVEQEAQDYGEDNGFDKFYVVNLKDYKEYNVNG